MRFLSFFVLALLLVAASLPICAQTTTGSIAGSVQDSQGAAIPNATVSAIEQNKKTTSTTVTDSAGRFTFAQLLPGRYTITIESAGFKKFERTEVVLNANDKLALGALALEVGTVAETVEVHAEATLLKTESAERSDALVGRQIENIAVNGRTYLALTALVPGVIQLNDYKTASHAGLSLDANGSRSNQNNLTLDGIGDVDTGNNGDQLATVSLDSVQEFRILTANYQAEYGRSAGAQISVVTKSGSSDFHGSGYFYHRHEGLNANNWKNDRDGLALQKLRFNDAGYTIGGPAYIPRVFNTDKSKLFFFWSQEYQRQLKPQGEKDVTMPTDLERAGDFSQSVDKNGNLMNLIRDPLLNKPCTKSDTSGCFQDGGVLGRIPQARLYGPGIAILKLHPEPNAVGFKGYNFRSQISDSYPRREDLIRLDYNLSQKWRLFGHYINNNDGVTSYYGSFVLGSNFPLVPITDVRPGRSFVITGTTILSPTTTNEATWGFSHNQINIDPVNDGLTRAKTGLSSLPGLYPSNGDYIPRFHFNGTRIANEPSFGTNNAPFFNYNTTIEWIDNFSKVWNQHAFKTGIYIQRSRKDQTSFANSSGELFFGDDPTNPLDTGFGFANAAVGVFSSYNQASQYATGLYRYTNIEWYVQDTWKVTRRLTLDYGMRFAWIQPQFDAALLTSTFLPQLFDSSKAERLYFPTFDASGAKIAIDPRTGLTAPSTAIGKIVPNSGDLLNGVRQAGHGVSKYLMENRGVHYAPRFGLAYDLTGKQNVVIRAGGGIFYDRYQGNQTFAMLTNPPTTFVPNLVNGLLKDVDPKNALLAPFGLNAYSFEGKVPTVYNFSFGVQTKLPHDVVLDTAYVGSLGRHLLNKLNLNAIPYGATFLPQNQDPTKVKASPAAQLGSNAYDRDFLRAYPGFGDITLQQMGGTSNYNSLQIGLNRRFSSGLFMQVAYTWSKALTTVSGDNDVFRIDGNTRKANYGPASFDRNQNLVINYVYDIPSLAKHFGNANNRATQTIFDGWQISGLTKIQSGAPFGVGFSIPSIGNPQLTGSYTEGARIRVIGDPRAGTAEDAYHRINPAAFAPPQPRTIGMDAPVNYLVGPGWNNWDISLQKTISITERVKTQLRLDAFNAPNHTQFSGINSTLNFTSLTNATPTNLVFRPDGTVNNINGFGSVNGARDPRILQLVVRLQF